MAPENDKRSSKSAIAGGAGGHRVVMAGHTGGHLFQPGNPGGPGRPRGSSNRLEADIRSAAVRAGLIKLDENGNRVGSDRDGCKAYLAWVALNDPRTYLAFMARLLPRNARSRKAPERWDPDPTA